MFYYKYIRKAKSQHKITLIQKYIFGKKRFQLMMRPGQVIKKPRRIFAYRRAYSSGWHVGKYKKPANGNTICVKTSRLYSSIPNWALMGKLAKLENPVTVMVISIKSSTKILPLKKSRFFDLRADFRSREWYGVMSEFINLKEFFILSYFSLT